MSSEHRQNLFGIAHTDADRRVAEFHAFELERAKLLELERQTEQQREQSELIRKQNEVLTRREAERASTPSEGFDAGGEDPSESADHRRAEEWEAGARYQNDPDYRTAYHAVLDFHGLDVPGFDPRALIRYGWDVRVTYTGIRRYREDGKFRSAFAWVMRRHGLPTNMIVGNLIKYRAAVDARRQSLPGRLFG